MRKLIAALVATLAVAFAVTPTATARPYLHLDEAQSALRGGYGSDNDVANWGNQWRLTFGGWAGYQRYNGYDLCVWVWYTDGTLAAFESYYPHSYDTGPSDIWDAFRSTAVCPQYGATQ